MDRFIETECEFMCLNVETLKSNMDRFIVSQMLQELLWTITLKSNMDRFIVIFVCSKNCDN